MTHGIIILGSGVRVPLSLPTKSTLLSELFERSCFVPWFVPYSAFAKSLQAKWIFQAAVCPSQISRRKSPTAPARMGQLRSDQHPRPPRLHCIRLRGIYGDSNTSACASRGFRSEEHWPKTEPSIRLGKAGRAWTGRERTSRPGAVADQPVVPSSSSMKEI